MKKFMIVFMLLGVSYLLAAQAGQGLPWEDPLTTIKNSITGPVAFGISILAIVGAGIGLVFGGEISGFIKTIIYIVLVIAMIVGAVNIMDIFTARGMMIWVSKAYKEQIYILL